MSTGCPTLIKASSMTAIDIHVFILRLGVDPIVLTVGLLPYSPLPYTAEIWGEVMDILGGC